MDIVHAPIFLPGTLTVLITSGCEYFSFKKAEIIIKYAIQYTMIVWFNIMPNTLLAFNSDSPKYKQLNKVIDIAWINKNDTGTLFLLTFWKNNGSVPSLEIEYIVFDGPNNHEFKCANVPTAIHVANIFVIHGIFQWSKIISNGNITPACNAISLNGTIAANIKPDEKIRITISTSEINSAVG